MEVIDARKKLTALSISTFIAEQADDTVITMVSEKTDAMFTEQISNISNLFRNVDVETAFTDDNDVISILSETHVLQFLGLDLKWYLTPVRGVKYKRLEKLFPSQTEEKVDKPKKVRTTNSESKPFLSVICATFDEDVEIDSTIVEGTKSDVIRSINNYMSKTLINSFFKYTVKFKLNYDDDWKTFEQLEEEGVFIRE